MEKSRLETQYEKLIVQHISNLDACPVYRAATFLDFYQSGRKYYDDLCDLLYEIFNEGLTSSLWMTNSGLVYIGSRPTAKHDQFIAESIEIPAFTGDLTDQLDFVFSRIYALTRATGANTICCY